jgi:hypothetical protein
MSSMWLAGTHDIAVLTRSGHHIQTWHLLEHHRDLRIQRIDLPRHVLLSERFTERQMNAPQPSQRLSIAE